MKKKILFIGAILGASFATIAQEEKVYTPVAEDWAIGIDATPFLNYLGNFIGGNGTNTAPTWDFQSTNQTITGKYFVSEDMAYRGSLRLGTWSSTDKMMVRNIADTATNNNLLFPNQQSEVESSAKMSGSFIGLSGGIEMRKGEGRLQGFYGGELGFSISSSKDAYTYGNDLMVGAGDTTTFVSVAAASPFGSTSDSYGNNARITEMNNGRTFTFGLRGFIGAEYFIFPKMALGAEFGWGLGLSNTKGSTYTTESIFDTERETASGTTIIEVGEQTVDNSADKSNGFYIDTDNNNSMFGASGSLRLTLHF